MPKERTIFRCATCDSQYAKWQGRCSECGGWGTITEQQVQIRSTAKALGKPASLVKLQHITATDHARIPSHLPEVDRVLGGGFVPGSVYLLGGDPGVGKSTLLLQAIDAAKCASLYFSGEESESQVKNRADRLGVELSHMQFAATDDLASIIATLESEKPALAVIDSVQTVRDDTLSQPAGSQTQVRAAAAQLIECAKRLKVSMVLVGHVTKGGAVAGPKTLEHLVDGVLYLEGEKTGQVRILRSVKNRFGSTDEIGVFEITATGLTEARDPARLFMGDGHQTVSGTAIAAIAEGSRIFFVEFQALLSKTSFGYPVRKAVGFDQNRLQMLIAVLQKRLALPLHQFDVHLNVVGGLRFSDPASDLAVVAAIISALKNIPIARSQVFVGEVGLGGEVRTVTAIDKRASEAKALGFLQVHIPADSKKKIAGTQGMKTIRDVLSEILKI